MKKKKLNLSGAFAFVLAVLVLAVFVPINMIFGYSDKVFDMTPSGKYSLDPVTKDVLSQTADKQIEIYFLNSLFNLKNEPNCLPVYHTLMELDSRDNITLTCFDPNEDVALANSLNPSGYLEVKQNDIFVKCDDVIKQISGNLFQQDSKGYVEYAGENLIAGAISQCASGNLPTVYFLGGYSSKTLENDYKSYKGMVASDNYNVAELNLSDYSEVPAETSILVIAAPDMDITNSDRDKIERYIDNGGAVQMLLPPSETKGRFSNIEYLLAKFEIGMNYNIIKETNTKWKLEDNDGVQSEEFFTVSYPATNEDLTVDLTSEINELVYAKRYTAGISNTRSLYSLSLSSEMIEKASIIENLPVAEGKEEYTIISEPVGGDEDTEAEAKALSNSPVVMGFYSYNKQTGAKLIVLGCDQPIDDSFLNVDDPNDINVNTFGTRRLVIFSNTWLCSSDINLGISNKFNSYDTMIFASGSDASRAINLFFALPVVFALIGLGVWLKRRYA